MQISIETTGVLGRRLHATVPTEQLEKAVEHDLKHYAHTAKLDGFRPGKVPMRIVKQYFGEQARAKAINELLQTSLREAFVQEKLNPVERSLSVESLETPAGQPMKYIVTFEVYPEIALPDFSSITLEKWAVRIENADVDQILEKIRKQHAVWQEVSRAAQWGDRVTCDVLVKTEQDTEPKKQQENVALVLEKDQLPAGFEMLNGAKAGDHIQIENAAGASSEKPTVELSVTVNTVSEPKLPELDAAFAEKLTVKEGTVEGLRTQVRQEMERELEVRLKNRLKTQLLEKLIASYSTELPKALVMAEKEHIQSEMQKNAGGKELPETAQQQTDEMAKRRVTFSLLFSEIAKQYQIKINDDQIRARVERIASSFEDSQAAMKLLYGYKEVMQNIRLQVMEDQVIDKILEQVKFDEKEVSYMEAIQSQQPQAGHVVEHEHGHDCAHDHPADSDEHA